MAAINHKHKSLEIYLIYHKLIKIKILQMKTKFMLIKHHRKVNVTPIYKRTFIILSSFQNKQFLMNKLNRISLLLRHNTYISLIKAKIKNKFQKTIF